MADFDFAPQPPHQSDDKREAGGFDQPPPASKAGPATQPKSPAAQPGLPGSGKKSGFAGLLSHPALAAAGGSPLSGLTAMSTLMGMARHSNPHIDQINSPTGLLGMMNGLAGMKSPAPGSEDHNFSLDASKNGAGGGGVAGLKTAIGNVGGPLQAVSQKDATHQAMKALGGLTRGAHSHLGSMISAAGTQANRHMHWLSQGARDLYKLHK